MIKELIFCTPFIIVKDKKFDEVQNYIEKYYLGNSGITNCNFDLDKERVPNENIYLLDVGKEYILLASFLFTEFHVVNHLAQRISSLGGEIFVIYSDLDAAQDRITFFRDLMQVYEVKRNGTELYITGHLKESTSNFITSIPFFEWDTMSITKELVGLDLYRFQDYETKTYKFEGQYLINNNELDVLTKGKYILLPEDKVKTFSLRMPDESDENNLLDNMGNGDIPF